MSNKFTVLFFCDGIQFGSLFTGSDFEIVSSEFAALLPFQAESLLGLCLVPPKPCLHMVIILELWSTGVIKGRMQASQLIGLCLSYSGLFSWLTTVVKDCSSENKIIGKNDKTDRHKMQERKKFLKSSALH